MKLIKPLFSTTVILLLALGFSIQSSAQVYYVGAGFNGGHTSLAGLNEMVKNYNQLRPTNPDKLKEFGFVNGLSINAGGSVTKLWFDLQMDFRGQKRAARDVDDNKTDITSDDVYGTRDFRIKNNSLSFTVGKLWQDKKPMMAAGLRADLGQLRLRSKIEYENGLKQDWEQVQDNYQTFRIGPSFKVFLGTDLPLGLIITAHYGINLPTANVTDWDIQINNTGYGGEKPDIFDIRANTFTLSFVVARIAA